MNFAKLCGVFIDLYITLDISLGVQTGSKIQNNTEQLHPTDAIDHSAQTCCISTKTIC